MLFTYTDKIKPYVRMTQKGKWNDPQAREYMASKAALAQSLKGEMLLSGYRSIPAKVPFKVSLFYQAPNVYQFDLANVLKAVMDAAQGVVFPDDRWCIQAQTTKGRGPYVLSFEVRLLNQELEPIAHLLPAIEAAYENLIYAQRSE